MEWCFGNDVDDLVVPKDQELLDRLPSPDSWSQWGAATLGSYEFPKKHFNGKSFCDNADISISGNEREWSSSMCHGSDNGSLQWTPISNEQPDYKLNDLARMDDIFLSSLLEEDDSSTDNLHGSSSFSARSNYSIMSADNLLSDMMLESQYVPSHTYGLGSSNYHKTDAFSPLVEWENGEVATSCTPLKVPVVNICVPSGQDSMSRYIMDMDEEPSTEESVLQELGRVTSQLTEKTRTCFRDSLYRLAENSKQQTVNPSQNGDLILEECRPMMVDETLRSVKTEPTELKTNAIDRAIANLMFNKMNGDHLAAAVSLNMEQGNGTTGHQFNQTQSTILAGDAEVPIISQKKLLAGFSEGLQ